MRSSSPPRQSRAVRGEHPEAISDWTVPRLDPTYDWFTPDVVKVAEYYEVEEVAEKLLILTHRAVGEEQRYWRARSTTPSSPR
jgi:hypothetical protein